MPKITKVLLTKITNVEKKKLDKLMSDESKLKKSMLEKQEKYSIEDRKGKLTEKKLQILANAGFKAEYLWFKKGQELDKYIKTLKNKYAK